MARPLKVLFLGTFSCMHSYTISIQNESNATISLQPQMYTNHLNSSLWQFGNNLCKSGGTKCHGCIPRTFISPNSLQIAPKCRRINYEATIQSPGIILLTIMTSPWCHHDFLNLGPKFCQKNVGPDLPIPLNVQEFKRNHVQTSGIIYEVHTKWQIFQLEGFLVVVKWE